MKRGLFGPSSPKRPGLQIATSYVQSLIDRHRDTNKEYIKHEAH